MTHFHNPIAQRIEYLRQYWTEQRSRAPQARLVRWLIDEADEPLLKGFFQLEASEHGTVEETIITLLTPFESATTYAAQLARHWLEMYESDREKYPGLQWANHRHFSDRRAALDTADEEQGLYLLADLLSSFKASEVPTPQLLVALLPRDIRSYKALNRWVVRMLRLLPEDIGFVLVDFKTENRFDAAFLELENEEPVQSLVLKNQDMEGACHQLMTQGDPNDPQVAFRHCMVEMGKASKAHRVKRVVHWGDRALEITQATGDMAFWASAHLVYAGFLFNMLETDRIMTLLDQGLRIGRSLPEDPALQSVTLQLHSFKAAYFQALKKDREAIAWYLKQARRARELEEAVFAVSGYKSALTLQKEHDPDRPALIGEAFDYGYALDDDLLRSTEFPFIAVCRLDRAAAQREANDQIEAIKTRMQALFGEGWEQPMKEQIKALNQKEKEKQR